MGTTQFDVNALPGIDAATFNQQQYKVIYLQALIQAGDISTSTELLSACARIYASDEVLCQVEYWAAENNHLGG